MVRAPDCLSGGCEFESRPPRFWKPSCLRRAFFLGWFGVESEKSARSSARLVEETWTFCSVTKPNRASWRSTPSISLWRNGHCKMPSRWGITSSIEPMCVWPRIPFVPSDFHQVRWWCCSKTNTTSLSRGRVRFDFDA